MGSNDTGRWESELTKTDFLALMGLLKQCGKSVFISGPIPTVGRGDERFSRILSLNYWLQHTCREHGVDFIDNFNVFWHKETNFKHDGIHPNPMGARLLAANVQITPCHLRTD